MVQILKLLIGSAILIPLLSTDLYAESLPGHSITLQGRSQSRVCSLNNDLCNWAEPLDTNFKIYIAKDGRIFGYSSSKKGVTTQNGGTATDGKVKIRYRHSGNKLTVTSWIKGQMQITDIITMRPGGRRCTWKVSAKFLHKRGKIKSVKSNTHRCTISSGNKFK